MIKRIILIITTGMLVLAACTSAPETAAPQIDQPEVQRTESQAPTQEIIETQAEVVEQQPAPTQEIQPPNNEPVVETEEPVEQPANQSAFPPGEVTLRILPEESEVRFLIDEVLLGTPTTVVGSTSAVEGELVTDLNNPSNAQVNIAVDLTTLVTDNSRRNGAIQRFILETTNPANQTAVFSASSISGLPEPVVIGQPFDFQIAGDLSVKGVTRELTFDGTATLVSEGRLEGSAATQTLYTDFTIIPSLPPQVASVNDAMILEIDFVAAAQ